MHILSVFTVLFLVVQSNSHFQNFKMSYRVSILRIYGNLFYSRNLKEMIVNKNITYNEHDAMAKLSPFLIFDFVNGILL